MAARTTCQRALLAALGLVAVVLAAWTLPGPLARLAAELRPKKAEVEFRVVRNVELKHGHAVSVTFRDGRQARTLTQGDYTTIQEGHVIAGPFQTATSGDLEISGALVDQAGKERAKGAINLPLKPDRRYGVWIIVGSGDPTAGCLGCAGSRSFPLDPALGYAPDVALSIVWGRNSISDPVVY